MALNVEAPPPEEFHLGFGISHQKVELDIDLRSRSLSGKTEITVVPEIKDLKLLRLDCRQCDLKGLTVNGKVSPGVIHEDPYKRASIHWNASVHQYHLLQERLEGNMPDESMKDLIITIPKSVKIKPLDQSSEEAQAALLLKSSGVKKRESGDVSMLDIAQIAKSSTDETVRYAPLTLIIKYEINHVRDGMHFVGWEEGDLRYPHAYSTQGSPHCLFPCLRELTSRCTWEISIKCSKTIGDAFRPLLGAKSLMQGDEVINTKNGVSGVRQGYSSEEASQQFNNEDMSLELAVVGPGDMTDEIVDSRDATKKSTSFLCSNSLSAQQIGFAIGPFEHVDLAEFRDSDEDDRLGQRALPVHGFCLPGRADDIKNTCLPLAKAIDYFVITYGAYPFSNYKLCFVDDVCPDILHNASLSICSSRLLFPEDVIEPMDRITRQLVHAVATQWIGVDIVPDKPHDAWVVIGIAYYITDMYMKKLSGNNEYRYNQKRAADRVVELDVDRPTLYDNGELITLDSSELELMELKAPLILFILDRRLIKSGTSLGMSRIISRIFLQGRTEELPNVGLDTAHFRKVCERIGHINLEKFFAQWVEGAGCPKFRVSQRFNKKKLVVEMSILQVQTENVKDKELESSTFMREVKEDAEKVYAGGIQNCFTGPMTIRIHEADGTPYEHIIEIKEVLTKFDVPYNTKYKRLKRSRRQKERTAAAVGMDYAGDGTDDVLLYSLGDVLQSEEEVKQWKLQDWSKEDDERMSQESYEWIRMDADFEWICKMSLSMPGYMWVSQLQQDRDVVAQLESVQFLNSQNGHPLISAFLVRTLMDQRYFHGIRTAAASALTKCAKDETDWIGFYHLEKAFQELFCYIDSPMTRPNDFSDRTSYLVQCAIPQAISRVRDNSGTSTFKARTFLLEKLKFNDNSSNMFSDSHYLAVLMRSLAASMSSKPAPRPHDDDFEDDDGDDIRFHNACLDEIDRYRRIDQWIPSYHNILSTTALDCERVLAKAGIVQVKPFDLLQYTSDGTADDLRLNAFANLMEIGLARNDAILRWFLFILGTDPSPYVREHMLRIFGTTLGAIAIGIHTEAVGPNEAPQDGLFIEQEASTDARKDDIARKQTVTGALKAMKDELGEKSALKESLWAAATSPTLSLDQAKDLLKMCGLLYQPKTEMWVTLRFPRYWKCTKVGKGKLVFQQSDRVRTTKMPKRQPKPLIITAPQPFIKRENSTPSSAMSAPPEQKSFLKPPKPPLQTKTSTSSVDSVSESPGSKSGEKKPKLKIKLKIGGAGGGGGAGSGSARSHP